MRARVIANFGATLAVKPDNLKIVHCNNRRKLGLIVCGDWIECETQDTAGQLTLATQLHPRTSLLARPDHKQQSKPLAANFDQLLIVIATRPEPDPLLIDTYLVYAAHINVTAILVINKADLIESGNDKQLFTEIQNRYEHLNYTVIRNSCKTEGGIEKLAAQLNNHTSILVGQSGVGKSSIIKSILPNQDIQTSAISAASGQGKHTTTTAMLYDLPNGGELIDSPGVREFSLGQLDPTIIRNGFIEFRELQQHCKFNNCSHIQEPSCAILHAITQSEISQQRWQNYKRLLQAQ